MFDFYHITPFCEIHVVFGVRIDVDGFGNELYAKKNWVFFSMDNVVIDNHIFVIDYLHKIGF